MLTETFNTFVLNKLYNLTKPYFKRDRIWGLWDGSTSPGE